MKRYAIVSILVEIMFKDCQNLFPGCTTCNETVEANFANEGNINDLFKKSIGCTTCSTNQVKVLAWYPYGPFYTRSCAAEPSNTTQFPTSS